MGNRHVVGSPPISFFLFLFLSPWRPAAGASGAGDPRGSRHPVIPARELKPGPNNNSRSPRKSCVAGSRAAWRVRQQQRRQGRARVPGGQPPLRGGRRLRPPPAAPKTWLAPAAEPAPRRPGNVFHCCRPPTPPGSSPGCLGCPGCPGCPGAGPPGAAGGASPRPGAAALPRARCGGARCASGARGGQPRRGQPGGPPGQGGGGDS